MFTKARIAISRLCQMNCIYCPDGPLIFMENYDGQEKYCLSSEELLGIIGVMVKSGVNNIHFTGGEPLIRKDAAEIISKTISMGAAVELNTNGLLITEKKMKELKEAGLNFLKISLDTPYDQEFLNFTGVDKLQRVLSGVKTAIKFMPVRLNCVVMKSNFNSIIPLLEMVEEIGVRQIHLLDLTYYSSCVGKKNFWENEFIYLTKDLMPILEEKFQAPFAPMDVFGCKFYKLESSRKGMAIVLKEAEPTMRSPVCQDCPEYCHEGIFTLRLSCGGYLNFCPTNNSWGVDSLNLYRRGLLGDALQRYSEIFNHTLSVNSFQKFLRVNTLKRRST